MQYIAELPAPYSAMSEIFMGEGVCNIADLPGRGSVRGGGGAENQHKLN